MRDIETIQPVNKRRGRCETHRDWFNLSIRDGADVRDIETGSTSQQETGQMLET